MTCKECVHKIEIGGSCHIGCNNPEAKPDRKIWSGCGVHPLNFDPFTVKSCNGFSDDPKDSLPREKNPWLDLIRILMH